MDIAILPLIKGLLLVPIALLPIINPLGGAPVFAATAGSDRNLAKRLARRVAINSWFVIVVSILVGSYVLALFGISLPVVSLGGGLLVASTAWRMLHTSDDDDVQAAAAAKTSEMSDAEIARRSFFPITFPMTTGPGTIAASIALGAQIPTSPLLSLASAVVAAGGAGLVALVLYLTYKNSARVLRYLGEVGQLVMTRLMAFILLCVGIQIMWNGWSELQATLR